MSKKTDKKSAEKPKPSTAKGRATAEKSSASGDKGQGPYIVSARKYRPQIFDDVIGQDAMIRTLKNSFSSGRIAQAYMLTGVRGVGKTTTARILARALNYQTDKIDEPTFDIGDLGEHCAAIIESRHVDVLEMDAASHTGVDNIRELIESARYKPATARYKIYIIDEVHMLSKGAFNALLKTLEEPPDHVKFIFATTEVRKVPVTVLSRCQRFDLKRVEIETLVTHFEKIAKLEGVKADKESLFLLAKVAQGSVRDGLSLFDQTIALGDGTISADNIRAMLGISDQIQIFELIEALMKGDVIDALNRYQKIYQDGADPKQILVSLAEAVHQVTRTKALKGEDGDQSLGESERELAKSLADRLPMMALGRAWQLLLKGINEVDQAPNPFAAGEMLLIRMAHMSEVPFPDDLLKSLNGSGSSSKAPAKEMPQSANEKNVNAQSQSASSETARLRDVSVQQAAAGHARTELALEPQVNSEEFQEVSIPQPESFVDVIKLVTEKRDLKLKGNLEDFVRLVRFETGHVEINLEAGAPRDLPNYLGQKLSEWTGKRWIVAVSAEKGEETITGKKLAERQRELEQVKNHPLVQQIFDTFPDARITDVSPLADQSDIDPAEQDIEKDE